MVIFTGISIGTLFTLYVVPAAYMLISTNRSLVEKDEETPEGAQPLRVGAGTPSLPSA
jgi:hypothetical protein